MKITTTYQCENCGYDHEILGYIYKCEICGDEICVNCDYDFDSPCCCTCYFMKDKEGYI